MPERPDRPPHTITFAAAALALTVAAILLAWGLRELAREELARVSPWLAHPASIAAAALLLFLFVQIVRTVRRRD